MPQSGQQQLEALQKDLACPDCEYNLRGLYGDIVNCPECGHECDIPQLLTNKWEGPWYKVPGLKRLYLPVFLCAGFIFYLYAHGIYLAINRSPMYYLSIGCVLFVFAWISSMYFIWRYFKSGYGILAALLMHLILTAYTIGAFGCAASFVAIFVGPFENDFLLSLLAAWFLFGFWMLILFANKSERWVAKQCIRSYSVKYHLPSE